jgi:hypothetical protein
MAGLASLATPEEGNDLRCLKCVAPPFAVANSVPSSALFAMRKA